MDTRCITKQEVQSTLKHGIKRSDNRGCMQIDYNGIAVITDVSCRKIITCFRTCPVVFNINDDEVCVVRSMEGEKDKLKIVGRGGETIRSSKPNPNSN